MAYIPIVTSRNKDAAFTNRVKIQASDGKEYIGDIVHIINGIVVLKLDNGERKIIDCRGE